jgi:hypothetical protein
MTDTPVDWRAREFRRKKAVKELSYIRRSMTPATLIADVRQAYERYGQLDRADTHFGFGSADDPFCALREIEREAARLFGKLNGWVLSDRFFPLKAIGHAHQTWDGKYADRGKWMVHSLHYRETERSVAFVGQPCNCALDDHRPELDACAARYGLRWHVPPRPSASISPEATLFVVMTLPDIKVVWL